MIWHHVKRSVTEASPLVKHNTSISSFGLCLCQSAKLVCLQQHKKWIRRAPKKRLNSTSYGGMWPRRKQARVFVLSRHRWGWSETRYLPHEKAAARSTWQSGQKFHWGFTDTLAVLCVCVCVCINSIGKQLSSDSAAVRGWTMKVVLSRGETNLLTALCCRLR